MRTDLEAPWVVMRRPTAADPWTVLKHHTSGRVYRYWRMEDAMAQGGARDRRHKRVVEGTFKVEREDRVDPALLDGRDWRIIAMARAQEESVR